MFSERLVNFGEIYYLITSLLLISGGVSCTACPKPGGPHFRNACRAGGLSVFPAFP